MGLGDFRTGTGGQAGSGSFNSPSGGSSGGSSNLSGGGDPTVFAPGPSSLDPGGNLTGLSFLDRLGFEIKGASSFDPITKNVLRAASLLIPGAGALTAGAVGLTALAKTLGIPFGDLTQADIDSATSSGKISDSDKKEFSRALNTINAQGGFNALNDIGSGLGPLSNDPLTRSAQENIALQKSQLERIEGLTAPFRDAGTGTALPTLSSLALGGDVDFQPSKLFGRQLERGREGILRSQTGGAGVKSSRTFERLSDLVSGLASEDVGRFEQGNTDLLRSGLRAEDILRQTGSSTAGTVGGIFGNLGQGLNVAEQQKGLADLSKSQTIAGGVRGLGDLLTEVF